jgi:hypothetical protein
MKPGISNRESADQEARERKEHPPLRPDPPPAETAGGDATDREMPDEDGQTSRKAGSRSAAQKGAGTRHRDEPAPPARKVAGAFGEEPGPPAERDVKGSLRQR